MRIFTGPKKILHQILYPVILSLCLILPGCNMKVKYLPQIEAPYFVRIEFLEKLIHKNGDIIRKRFRNNMIRPDFYIYLKIDNVEDQGKVELRFYRSVGRTVPQDLREIRAWMKEIMNFLIRWLPRCPRAGFRVDQGYDLRNSGDAIEWLPILGKILFQALSRSPWSPVALDALNRRFSRYVQVKRLNFDYGESGKYFEYIIFIDRILNMRAGKYRYAVFLNSRLLAGGRMVVHPRPNKKD